MAPRSGDVSEPREAVARRVHLNGVGEYPFVEVRKRRGATFVTVKVTGQLADDGTYLIATTVKWWNTATGAGNTDIKFYYNRLALPGAPEIIH